MTIETIHADITTLHVDAIVNAADITLSGGGGVDGAIHAAAGPELALACRPLGGCNYGEAKLTKGYNLPAAFVIHTVGPIYGQHHGQEPQILYSCYYASLELADKHHITSIAFPEIATGIYHYPKDEARQIARTAIAEYFKNHRSCGLEKVLLVIYGRK